MTAKADRQAILERTQGRCAYCGCDLEGVRWQVDHFHPRMQPVSIEYGWGIHHTTSRHHFYDVERLDNKLAACPSCNAVKSSETIEMFRYKVGHFIASFNRDSAKYRMCKRYGLIEETGNPVVFEYERQGVVMPELEDLLVGECV